MANLEQKEVIEQMDFSKVGSKLADKTSEDKLTGIGINQKNEELEETVDFKAKYQKVKDLNKKLNEIDERDWDKKKEIDQQLFTIVSEINKDYGLGYRNNSLNLKALDNGTLQIELREGSKAIHINIDENKATKIIYNNSHHSGEYMSIKEKKVFYKRQ